MKIALTMGRGKEGAGITRFCIELSDFLTKEKIDHDIFILDDKKWGRGGFQQFSKEPKYITKENISEIHNILNTYTYNFLNSVPSIKHSEWAIKGFLQMVKDIHTKKIIFQNDHKIASIHRNANFFEICNLCDGIVSHSINSPFYRKLVELFGDSVRSKFIQLQVGFNFSQLFKYRKENHLKKITYLGRYATFKQPDRLFGFLPYASNNGLLLEMKGVERSLGALNIFYDDIEKRISRHDMIEVNRKALENGLVIDNDKRDLSKIYIFGPYDYVDGMESLSSSLVGADFYHLAADAYGDNFEYAQCEIIGAGTVPMFDYHWAENCWIWEKGKKTDKRFVDLDTYGLFVKKDLSNVQEIVEKINDIYSSKALEKKYLECSLEVTREHCDSEYLFENLINAVTNIEKAKIVKSKSLF
jgi:hypothetical protein